MCHTIVFPLESMLNEFVNVELVWPSVKSSRCVLSVEL